MKFSEIMNAALAAETAALARNLTEAAAPDTAKLTQIIVAHVAEYGKRGKSPQQINCGDCDGFAHDVLDEWVGEGWQHQDGTFFHSVESASFYVLDEDEEPIDWDWKLLQGYWKMPRPTGRMHKVLQVIAQDRAQHVWIATSGRHFDAEAPQGVANFFELPFFQRWIAGVSAELHENASAGATSAASIATGSSTVGGLGIGFSPSGDKGIYQGKSKKKATPNVIRR